MGLLPLLLKFQVPHKAQSLACACTRALQQQQHPLMHWMQQQVLSTQQVAQRHQQAPVRADYPRRHCRCRIVTIERGSL